MQLEALYFSSIWAIFPSPAGKTQQRKTDPDQKGDSQHNGIRSLVLLWFCTTSSFHPMFRRASVEPIQTSSEEASFGYSFRLAKVDHYLERAEECIRMSRFYSARQLITKVYALDPGNVSGKSLEKRIDYAMSALSGIRKGNRPSEEFRGNGTRRTRDEVVMVVDQDEKVLLAMTDRLRRDGFEVVCAAGYGEALEILASITPGIIVSEVNFENGPAGFDLFLWVRTNGETAGTPFMYVATKIDRDTLVAGKRLGVDDFILKPLDEDIIVASIMQCLRRQRRRES